VVGGGRSRYEEGVGVAEGGEEVGGDEVRGAEGLTLRADGSDVCLHGGGGDGGVGICISWEDRG
jgi:hypothetical protein